MKDYVLSDLHEVVHALAERKSQKIGAWKALNTPVMVALVSGGVLSGLVTLWQNNTAKNQRNEARRIELQERKERAFIEFADNFPKSIALASEYKLREAYLNEHIRKVPSKRPLYYDGRDYDQTRALAAQLKSEFLKGRMPDSVCGNILTSFKSAQVLQSTKMLRAKCDGIIESFSGANIYQLGWEINSQYKVVLQHLEHEIKKERNESITD